MMDTYRVRHAIRDVGAALGLPPGEIDAIAKAFPHIRARDARAALRRPARAAGQRLARAGRGSTCCSTLVERLDGLPRHVALHPCGVLLSDATLLDRTPVEASWLGFPMSQFDKDDVEDLGLLKLDVLGIRMQSAMAHAVERDRAGSTASTPSTSTTEDAVPARRPGDVRGSSAPTAHPRLLPDRVARASASWSASSGRETFDDLIIDISLFRPGPVKSDMVTPFLRGPAGLAEPRVPPRRPASRRSSETCGVVVFHEQVLQIVASHRPAARLAEADEVRRALGSPDGQPEVARVVLPAGAAPRATPLEVVERVWEVLKAFASFGFCKAHAAAFALPTYQSAWLKAHHPGGVPRRGAHPRPGHVPQAADPRRRPPARHRRPGLDVNASDATTGSSGWRVRRAAAWHPRPATATGADRRPARRPGLRHPAVAGRRQGHHRRRGRAHRRRPALRLARRLLAPRPGRPARSSSGSSSPAPSTACTASARRSRSAAAAGHPPRPAAPGRRPRPLDGRRRGRSVRRRAGPAPTRAASARTAGRRSSRRSRGSPRPRPRPALRRAARPRPRRRARRPVRPGCRR